MPGPIYKHVENSWGLGSLDSVRDPATDSATNYPVRSNGFNW